jgi:hypothetical protein
MKFDPDSAGYALKGSGISFQSQCTDYISGDIIPCYAITVSGNTTARCDTGAGIRCFQAENSTISGNVVEDCGKPDQLFTNAGGIQVNTSMGINCSGNTVTGCVKHGIWYYLSTYGLCSNNLCMNNDQYWRAAAPNSTFDDNTDGTYSVVMAAPHGFIDGQLVWFAGTGALESSGGLDSKDYAISNTTATGFDITATTGRTLTAPGTSERRSFSYGIIIQSGAAPSTPGYTVASGNMCGDTQATQTQYGGLRMRNAQHCTVTANVISDVRSPSTLSFSGCAPTENSVGFNQVKTVNLGDANALITDHEARITALEP